MPSILRFPGRLARVALREFRERLRGPMFPHFERLGLHVTTSGWNSPSPDLRELDAGDVLARSTTLSGIDMAEAEQIALLGRFAATYRSEYDELTRDGRETPAPSFRIPNGFYETVDAETLYCFIRERKPRRVIEIGSGHSTLVAAEALARNRAEGGPSQFTTIDPYPKRWLADGGAAETRVIPERVQDVPLATFEALEAGDVLVIDSSHIVKTGSDVCYEFLEILPRLRPGVAVHVHDIFLPEEYPREWVEERHYFWTEQYLLQAFLIGNADWRVRWAGRYMHVHHPELLRRSFSSYERARTLEYFPSSFWVERVP